jgi:hypothetical protein
MPFVQSSVPDPLLVEVDVEVEVVVVIDVEVEADVAIELAPPAPLPEGPEVNSEPPQPTWQRRKKDARKPHETRMEPLTFS